MKIINKKAITFVVMFLAIGCSAHNSFNIRLWEEGDASRNTLVLRIERHCCCSGNVALVKVKRMPHPGEGPFAGEKVIELSEDNKILRKWYMPVDEIVLGIEDSFILSGYGNSKTALRIGTDGNLSHVPAPKFEAESIDCPSAAQVEFPDSGYLGCFVYRDLRSGQRRILGYQGPCT